MLQRQFMVTTEYITSYMKINYHIRLNTMSIYDANKPILGTYFMTKVHINHQVQHQWLLKRSKHKNARETII